MAQLIDKDALVAEIKRREELVSDPILLGNDLMIGERNAFFNLLSFIDTLEVKEKNFIWNNAKTTVPEDSTNQIICIKEDGLAVSTVGKIVNGTIKWAYLDDLINTNSFNLEVKEVDLENRTKILADIIFDAAKNGYMPYDTQDEHCAMEKARRNIIKLI